MSSKQRSIKNAFLQPQFQLKLSLYYIVVGGILISAVGAIVFLKLNQVRDLMNNSVSGMSFQVQNQVNDLMLQSVQISLLGFLAFILFSFGFALVTSHRIAGPQVAIRAVVEEMKQGNYEPKRNLRPRDELHDVMDAIKELAASLKEKEQAKKAE